jgi:molybdopterin-containing oxidoreductase family molybdopterin binding subunit
LFPANDPYAFITPGPGEWFWTMRQPVVAPPPEARPWTEVYLEIADRLGLLDEVYAIGNDSWMLGDKHKLESGKKYTIRDIAERQAKTIVGESFDWDMLKDTSTLITREKTIEEAYPRPFMRAKIPLYFEHLLGAAEDLRVVTKQIGLSWNFDPYVPLPQLIPCAAMDSDEEFDLISMNFKVPFHTFSTSAENIWIDEISRANPYAYRIMVNRGTAEKKSLKAGDRVWVESRHGKLSGQLLVTELIHPDCVGIGGTFGHWAHRMPISNGKGTCYNGLLPSPSVERIDTISGQIDMCTQVKIYKK